MFVSIIELDEMNLNDTSFYFKFNLIYWQNGQDGTKYFDIYENGTLYVKSELDYETTACGLSGNGQLYLNVIIQVNQSWFFKTHYKIDNLNKYWYRNKDMIFKR